MLKVGNKVILVSRFGVFFVVFFLPCLWVCGILLCSLTGDGTHTPCIGSVESFQWTTREVLKSPFLKAYNYRYKEIKWNYKLNLGSGL